MTVKELIAQLSKLPKDAVVNFDHPDMGIHQTFSIEKGYVRGFDFHKKKKSMKKMTKWDIYDWHDIKYGHLDIPPPVPESVDVPIEKAVVFKIRDEYHRY